MANRAKTIETTIAIPKKTSDFRSSDQLPTKDFTTDRNICFRKKGQLTRSFCLANRSKTGKVGFYREVSCSFSPFRQHQPYSENFSAEQPFCVNGTVSLIVTNLLRL
jgi:hypothetical protein